MYVCIVLYLPKRFFFFKYISFSKFKFYFFFTNNAFYHLSHWFSQSTYFWTVGENQETQIWQNV